MPPIPPMPPMPPIPPMPPPGGIGGIADDSVIGFLRNHRFGGQQHAGDRGGILQCRADDFGGIDDARLEQVFIFFGGGIEAEGAFAFFDFLQRDGAFDTGVDGNAAQRFFGRRA